MIFQGEHNPEAKCPYCERVLYEWDTGYAEFGCTLGEKDPEKTPCFEEDCPLKCKWRVEE